MKKLYFIAGVLSAISFASFANLPRTGHTGGSMATKSDVSEIRAKRQADLSFDSDLKRLSDIQGRYRENLRPHKIKAKKALKTSHVRAKVTQN